MANGNDTTEDTAADTAVDPKLANLVNSAVSSHLKRHMKGLGDQLGSMLDERLAKLGNGNASPAKPQSDGVAAGATNQGDDVQKEVAQLRNELKAQKMRAAEKEVFADVRSILSGKVRPEAMDTALKVLKADGLIKIDARDGSAVVKHPELGDLDLNEGIAEWLKGEGALFAPVASGKRPPVRGPSRAPTRPTATASDEGLTPAQKTARDLQARGFSLG